MALSALVWWVLAQEPAPLEPPPAAVDEQPSSINPAYLGDIVRRLAHDAHQEALRHVRAEDYPAALSALLEAQALDPTNPEIEGDLGYTYQRLGNFDEAEAAYRRTLALAPERLVTTLNLADLWLERGRPVDLVAADELLGRARERVGNVRAVLLRQARLASRRLDSPRAATLYDEVLTVTRREAPRQVDELLIEIGDFELGLDHADEARKWYEQVSEAGRAPAEARIRQLEIDEEARRLGWTPRAVGAVAEARVFLERAETYLGQGRLREASAALREALRRAPSLTLARVRLGDLALQRGEPLEAEQHYLLAAALDPSDAEPLTRLGRIYLDQEKRAGEAVLLLERAIQIDPERPESQWALTRAYQRSGDLPRALGAVEAFLTRFPDHEVVVDAQTMRLGLLNLLQKDDAQALPPPEGELQHIFNRVRALLARGEADAAMAELRRASQAPDNAVLRNLKARILRAAGQKHEAREAFLSSLQLDAEQPLVHQELGALLLELADLEGAETHLQRAEELGADGAAYQLARLRGERAVALPWWKVIARVGGLWSERQRLERFLSRRPDSLYASAARTLREQLGAELWIVVLSLTLPLGALAAGLGLVGRHRWGGRTLRELLTAHPESGAEVQQVLAAIRHEVLKHNTLVLSGLVESLRGDEPLPPGATAALQALGGGTGVVGLLARLTGYAAQLEQLGRASGLRLNLRRRDPALAPIFSGLRRLRSAVRRAPRLAHSSRGRRRLTRKVARAARDLNTLGYPNLCDLLDGLRTLRLDSALLRDIFAQARGEPAFAGIEVADLEVSAEAPLPLEVDIVQAPFEDILRNLFRNALQAMASEPGRPLRVGCGVSREVHSVTGHPRVRLAVCDRSAQRLDDRVLRDRDVEGGLGLTSALASRYHGSLRVEPGDAASSGWTKAVVLRLPLRVGDGR